MKRILTDTLINLAKHDNNLFLMSGDLGFPFFLEFSKLFPDRFINAGIAEQNMIGVAAGLALSGKTVFVYSIVNFATIRCLDQIRNDLCYQNLNVKIVGYGSGLTYGKAGATHSGLEDIAVMQSLPNMMVFSPGNIYEAERVIKMAYESKGPAYIRLGKLNSNIVCPPATGEETVTIFVTGTLLNEVIKVKDLLFKKGIFVKIISLPIIKPLDVEVVKSVIKNSKAVLTVEEHSVVGGLGSSIANVLAEENINIIFKKIGLPDSYSKIVGSQDYLRHIYLLDAQGISKTIIDNLKNGVK